VSSARLYLAMHPRTSLIVTYFWSRKMLAVCFVRLPSSDRSCTVLRTLAPDLQAAEVLPPSLNNTSQRHNDNVLVSFLMLERNYVKLWTNCAL